VQFLAEPGVQRSVTMRKAGGLVADTAVDP
jgi:hypothetical protein